MREFPQELVDKVVDELFTLVGRGNGYQGRSKRFDTSFGSVRGISHYSLVSKAWADPAQKHHFSTLYLDRSAMLKKWLTRIPPDPTGVSRHVRKLVLYVVYPKDLEDYEEHLRAFIRVESLTINCCNGILHHQSVLEWFSTMGSSLTELQIIDSPVAPHTMTSLLAALPLLQILQILPFRNLDDTDDVNPPVPPRIPFFEGTNRFVLDSNGGSSYPAGSLDWIPTSALFGQLEVDAACVMAHPDLVNQWLASSCTTLKNLAIRGDPHNRIPGELKPLNLSPCTTLESLRIPIIPFVVETFLPHITSTRLATIILDLDGRFGRRTIKLDDEDFGVVERHLCPLAQRFNDAHPGRKMEVGVAGYTGERRERILTLRTLNDRKFMPILKKVANFVIPPI